MVNFMAAGDAHRVWFPETIERYVTTWTPCCNEFDQSGASGPQFFECSRCGYVGEGADPRVSVRALILSLGRFGIDTADQMHALEKDLGRKAEGYRA